MALCIRCLTETPVCCVRRGPFVCNYALYLNSKTLQICQVTLPHSKPQGVWLLPVPLAAVALGPMLRFPSHPADAVVQTPIPPGISRIPIPTPRGKPAP